MKGLKENTLLILQKGRLLILWMDGSRVFFYLISF